MQITNQPPIQQYHQSPPLSRSIRFRRRSSSSSSSRNTRNNPYQHDGIRLLSVTSVYATWFIFCFLFITTTTIMTTTTLPSVVSSFTLSIPTTTNSYFLENVQQYGKRMNQQSASSSNCRGNSIIFSSSSSSSSSTTTTNTNDNNDNNKNVNTNTALSSWYDNDDTTATTDLNRRSGMDGYSVNRRPAVWDPTIDPEFAVPTTLLDDDDNNNNNDNNNVINNNSNNKNSDNWRASSLDNEWWENRKSGKKDEEQTQTRSSSNNNNKSVMDQVQDEANQLDLFQRSYDTLDFDRILQALQKECTTVPARNIIRLKKKEHNSPSSTTTTTGSSLPSLQQQQQHKEQQKQLGTTRMDIVNQPLTADTVTGSQERYRAVQEMSWLITSRIPTGGNIMSIMNRTTNNNNNNNNNNNYEQIDYYTYQWRNRLGYQQTLFGRPPPFMNNGFNLQAILNGELLDLDHPSASSSYYDSSSSFGNKNNKNQRRVLEGSEILAVSDMLDIMENIILWNTKGLQQVTTGPVQFVELTKIANCITVNQTLQELLHNAFEENNQNPTNRKNNNNNNNNQQQQQRRLNGVTFPKIGQLRAQVRTLKANVMDTLNQLLSTPGIQSKLALESGGATISEVGGQQNQQQQNGGGGGRLVIPIHAKYASKVGIVHDTSRSGKTVYCEPSEIVVPTNQLRQAESELRNEENRIWRLLTEQIYNNQLDIECSIQAIGQLDLIYAKYSLGTKIRGVIPIVQNEGVIELRDAKHPVLVLRENVDVVGSTIQMGGGKNQGLVLTGPNAGGKTVILKLIGLVALMARCGIPIPASTESNTGITQKEEKGSASSSSSYYQPRVDFFNPVLADIGDLQSVGSDLSTFSGHMLVCREVLNNSGANALVLMDELGSGTDPAQGVAIAQAILEALIDSGARVVITTHYMQLKQLAASDDRFAVAGMQFVRGRPTYKLLPGTVGESFALAVAERLQLPMSVLNRATELLDSETRQMGDLLRDMENQKALVDEQLLELEQKKLELEQAEMKMKDELIRMEKKQLNVRRDEAKKFAQILEEKEKILENVLDKLKSDPTRRIIAKSWDDIKFVRRDVLNEAENIPSVIARRKQSTNEYIAATTGELVPLSELRELPVIKPGDQLVVCKAGPLLGRSGEVITFASNRVDVRVGNINVSLKLGQVALPNGSTTISSANTNKSIKMKGGNSIAKAAERAIASENAVRPSSSQSSKMMDSTTTTTTVTTGKGGIDLRTQSNTVDVLGCNFMDAQERIQQKISTSLSRNRKTIYVLHGHGTGGILKNKIRMWLKQQEHSKLVKSSGPADSSDGGDAFTRVVLN